VRRPRRGRRWQLPRRRARILTDVIDEYRSACATSDDIAARYSLDDTAEHAVVGAVSLRFIYLGMIGEIARHAGHADILAEQLRARHGVASTNG
jgi:hypothetical protein